MLHCWPFLQECGFLAKDTINIFIDTCWQPVLNPAFLKQSFALWLNYVPLSKITMGNDATTIEMAAGSSFIAKNILASALSTLSREHSVKRTALRQIAADFLHNNAVAVYGIGDVFSPS